MNNLDFTMINFWLLPSFAWLRLFLLSILHVPISIFARKDIHGVGLDLSDAVIYEQPHSALHAVGGMTVSFQSIVKLATKNTSTMLSK